MGSKSWKKKNKFLTETIEVVTYIVWTKFVLCFIQKPAKC